MERTATVQRKTGETDISLELNLDARGEPDIDSGIPFFDHMLTAMAKHGRFFLKLRCAGDTDVDDHHSVEDIGIALGTALKDALGDKKGITRFGNASVPLDEALTDVTVDLSGRPFFSFRGADCDGYIGRYSEELTKEFLRAFSMNGMFNLHVVVQYGENRHHIHETIFKALGVALNRAASPDPSRGDSIPSTKGTL